MNTDTATHHSIATKWPRLIVTGQPVTHQQANEILLRTNCWWYLGGNDRLWTRLVADAVSLTLDGYDNPTTDTTRALIARWNVLELEYLANARIESSWIGGPHGWCDWNGTIGCANYNIGKWPSAEQVTAEWAAIAAAFPFLSLDAQVVEDEGEADTAAVQWRVRDGVVEVVEPGELLRAPSDVTFLAPLMIGGERGVPLSRLREAVAQLNAEPEVTA